MLELGFRDKIQLFEVLPRAVVEPKRGKRGIFGVEKVPVVKAGILRLVEEANARRAGVF